MIQYGTIVHGQKGIARSQSNTIEGTFDRCAAIQLASPYEIKNNGARNASHRAARRQGRSAIRCSSLPLGGADSGMRALTARQRDREDVPLVDSLLELAETGVLDQLIHFGLRAPAHDPWSAATMTRECARDQLELRMPWLSRINEKAAVGDRVGKTGKRRAHRRVIGKELVQSGDDADRRSRRDAGKTRAVECVAAYEPRDLSEALGTNERVALFDVELAVIAQQNRIGRRLRAIERFQYVTAVSRRDVDDVHEHAGRTRERHRFSEQFFEMQFPLTDAAPANRVEIVTIDQFAQQSRSAGPIAIDVVERASGIEAGLAAEPNSFR